MALLHSFEKSGNWLFRHRGIVPVFVFALCSPVLLLSSTFLRLTWHSTTSQIILACIATFVSLLGIIVRAYTIGTTPRGTSGRNTDKQVAEQLNTKGIYSIVRHPLYLGNYLMWLGLLIFIGDLPFLVCVSLVYWLYYERIMFAEERFLEGKFGQAYLDWSLTVPAFWPDFSHFEKGSVPFSFKAVLRREYSGIFAITLCLTLVDYCRAIFFHLQAADCAQSISFNGFCWLRPSGIICLVMLVLMLICRTLKHHTTILAPESDRD